MTPRRDARQVALFRMEFPAKPVNGPPRMKGIPPYDLTDVIDALAKAVKNGKASIYYKQDGSPFEGFPNDAERISQRLIEVTLEDLQQNRTGEKLHSYTLRFSYSNPFAADPGKRNLITRRRDILEIKDGEAGDVGAHMVIAPTEISGLHAGMARCALEQMTGLSRSKVVTLIQTVADAFMADHARPTYDYEVKKGPKKGRGKIKKDTTRLRVDALAEKSESLKEDLDNGILEEVEFLGQATETDALPQGLERPRKIITVKVEDSHRRGASARKLIEAVAEFARKHNYRAKINLKKEEEDRVKHQTRELVLDKAGLLDQLFVRQTTISPDDDMPMCYSTTSESIRSALVAILDERGLWQ